MNLVGIGALAAWLATSVVPAQAQAITPEDARAIAVEAYFYLYPLVSMDFTRKQMINVKQAEGLAAPQNQFVHVPTYPTADMRSVVRPNFDTLYSSAWVDLTREPVVVTLPDTKGRYYLLPLLDMWTDVFASLGWRTTGKGPQTVLLTSPLWRPELRSQFETLGLPAGTQRIDAPTPHIWVLGRIKTDGPPDYPAVHALQAQMKITPLSQWGRNAPPPTGIVDPSVDMKTPPRIQADMMPGEKFFAYAAGLMKLNPPHLTDQPIVARMKRIGLIAGQSFDPNTLDPVIRKAINQAPREGIDLLQRVKPTIARNVNGWSFDVNSVGVYGDNYTKRALTAREALATNLPEDSVYPSSLSDINGQPLSGAYAYRIHFSKADLPPVAAFWSLTLYDDQGFQVANPLNRFALSSWGDLTYNSDGSLDLYIQNKDPGEVRRSNWLPAPQGSFTLMMRLYAPAQSVLLGRWVPPGIQRDSGDAADLLPLI